MSYDKPPSFHADEFEPSSPEEARFHIIPVPWEASVSYGKGTAQGPNAILHASVQLEAYLEGEFPGAAGIYTAPSIDCEGDAPTVLSRIQKATTSAIQNKAIPILLGGEHAMTTGPIKAFIEQGIEFGVVQFDAHADLRETYEGTPHSHACVMKRIADLNIP
ncbi:MAG: arginase family protein, partial [Verrucomicrobiota bacterium]